VDIDVLDVKVLRNLGDEDVVVVKFGPTVSSPFPIEGLPPTAQIRVAAGFGAQWVLDNFKFSPSEVIECGRVRI
jgi:hypothetical protein